MPVAVDAGGGDRVVHLQQTYRGLDVVGGTVTIVLSKRAGIRRAFARTARVDAKVEVAPRCDPIEALKTARQATHKRHSMELARLGADPASSEAAPEIVARVEGAPRATVIRLAGFEEPVIARLVVWPTPRGARLAWEVDINCPEVALHDTVYVAASGSTVGSVLGHLDRAARAARALVYRLSPDEGDREPFELPPALSSYPMTVRDGGPGFPGPWVAQNVTDGNNVTAFSDQVSVGAPDSSGTIEFRPTDSTSLDQAVVNLFTFCNELHDLFWLLGFREAEGNCQKRNEGPDGRGGDPVRARVLDAPVSGGATTSRSRDGSPVFLVSGKDADGVRFAALDADIIFHEYTHAVTHRMIGGRFNSVVLTDAQPLAMSEGWSDFFALSFLNVRRGIPRTVFGTYFSASPGGMRSAPYDDQFDHHATCGRLGSPGRREPHESGEIWCAALAETERRLAESLSDRFRAAALSLQVVFDSLRRVPAEPTFLNGRDAMLEAADALARDHKITTRDATLIKAAISAAFAWLGMGKNARSPRSDYDGIVEDFLVAL